MFQGLLAALGVSVVCVVTGWIISGIKQRSLRGRKNLREGLALLAILASGLGLTWLLLLRLDPFNQAPFNQQIWLTAKGDPENPRGPMARALIARRLKKGIPRAQVIQLLGAPDQTETFQGRRMVDTSGYEHTRSILRYYLGAWSGMRIDGDYLDLAFDGSGRLIGAWIWQN